MLPLKRKNASKLSSTSTAVHANNMNMGPEQWVEYLSNAPATIFIHELLTAVYINGKSSQKRQPPSIHEKSTWYHYSHCIRYPKFFTHAGETTDPTIILSCCYNLNNLYVWDTHQDERIVKKKMSIEKRLQHVRDDNYFLENAELVAKRKVDAKTPMKERFNMGCHLQKKFSYQMQTAMHNRENKLSNALLIAFIDTGKKSGKYRTVPEDNNDSYSKPEALYWNGEEVNLSHVQRRLVSGINKPLYVSKQLKIIGTGFKDENVAYFRVGDWMNEKEIQRAVDVCKEMSHVLPVFLAICCSHRLNEAFVDIDLAKEERRFSVPLKDKSNAIHTVMKNAIPLMKVIRGKLIKYLHLFSIDDFVRCG